jgi:hypothetical protein
MNRAAMTGDRAVRGASRMRATNAVSLAWRMARRMASQSAGRSALVVALIAIPILGLAGIDTIEASHDATPMETATIELGHTQGVVRVVSAPDPKLRQDPFDTRFIEPGSNQDDSNPAVLRTPSEVLPTGTRILPTFASSAVVRTATGVGSLTTIEGQTWNRSLAGAFDLESGRRPEKAGEVVVSPHALTRLGIGLGGTVTEVQPAKRTFTVVGTLHDAVSRTSDDAMYGFAHAFAPAPTTASDVFTEATATKYYVPDLALPWSVVRRLNHEGMVVTSRSVLLDPPSPAVAPRFAEGRNGPLSVLFVALLGAFALFEVCLLAGAAFAVGARHRQRGLAILSSVGATRRMIFAVMSVEGILLGLLGGVVGTALGLAAGRVAVPILAQGSRSTYPGFHVDVVTLMLIVLGAALSGWAASAVPARAASRVDVVAALRGARRPQRSSVRRPAIGVIVVAVGSVVTMFGGVVTIAAHQSPDPRSSVTTGGVVLLVAGPVIMQVGMVLIAPLLLRWSSTVLSRWGTAARLGSRDASRNLGRTVPALAAVMSCVFVSAFAMCMISGGQEQSVREYSWQAPVHSATVSLYDQQTDGASTVAPAAGVIAALQRDLPGSDPRVLSSSPDFGVLGDTVPTYTTLRVSKSARTATAGRNDDAFITSIAGQDHITVGSIDDLRAILNEPVSRASRTTLAAGGVVSLYPEYVHDGRVTFDTVKSISEKRMQDGDVAGKPIRTVSAVAVVQRAAHPFDYGVFLLPETAARLGIHVVPSEVLATSTAAPTTAQADAATNDILAVNQNLSVDIETGPVLFAAQWSWALLVLTTVIVLGASSIALALARADGLRDSEVLVAVGAAPRVQRAFGFWQGIVIAGVGAVIGVALGLVPAFALGLRAAGATSAYLPFAPPWLQLGLTAVAMPLLIAAGAWLAGRRRLPTLRTRRDRAV